MSEKAVYKAIAAVASEIAATGGISKDKKNEQQGYKFRGIDDVYTALAPVLAKHKLCMLPRFTSRTVTERQTAKGGVLFYTVVDGEFDLVSAEDGSVHTVRTFGEAMDSGDKSTNKAMSAAYKYAAFQSFCIPVDAEDADKHTHTDIAPVAAASVIDDIFSTAAAASVPTTNTIESLRKKIWAKAKEAKIDADQIKEYSTITLQKPSSKDWNVEDCEMVLEWIEYKRSKN